MDPVRWRQVETVFHAALEIAPGERGRFLVERCGEDEDLRREVASLLAGLGEGEHGGLTSIVAGAAVEATAGTSISAGERLGPYRILRVLGRGGMGEVYEAEQEEPVRRRVALKLVRWGMGDAQVLARFESERQALALMDHPAIASVFDAGTAGDGRPYFVMELVSGTPIDAYCDSRALSIERRVELFVEVCRGVEHAHQKGIIHRDLKPSNVLIAEDGGRPLPKVIDFGIAKATTAGRLSAETIVTRLGQVVGTPEYMSPEQADSMGVDVDTRSDVYSLGVLLYELLAGVPPLEVDASARASVHELLRVIREQEPAPPSRRVAELGENAGAIAARRSTTPRGLARQLRAELDWIPMKALDKERARRYATAGALAEDLERHLHDQPVVAGPPSRAYRLRKLVRRHRAGTFAGAVVALSLVAGLAVASAGLVRARAAQRRAVAEAATAREVSDFLTGLFAASDPIEEKRAQTTARELLDLGAAQIAERLDEQPATKARLLTTIGAVYDSLGALEDAEAQLQAALTLHGSAGSADSPLDRARTLERLAAVERRLGRIEEAEPHARQSLAIRREILGDDHPDTGEAWDTLGVVLVEGGDWTGAEEAAGRATAIAEATAPGTAVLGLRLYNLAGVYHLQGRFRDTLPPIERAVELTIADRGEDYPMVGHMLNGLGITRLYLGDYAGAEEALTRSLEIRTRTFGADHYSVGESVANLAVVYNRLERPRDGAAAARRAIEILTPVLGPDHQRIANAYEALGIAHVALRELEQARAAFERTDEIRRLLPADHPDRALGIQLLGTLEVDAGNLDRGRELLHEALAERAPLLGEGHPEVVQIYVNLGRLERAAGNLDESAAQFEKVLHWSEQAGRLAHPDVREPLEQYADLLRERGASDRATALDETLEQALAAARR